jgi:hypothetical protein
VRLAGSAGYHEPVAAWRLRALESFPDLRDELNRREEIFSIYALWFRLLPLAEHAHRVRDEQRLAAIYDFALWCFDQPAQELWNSVAVSFFEPLLQNADEALAIDVLNRVPDHVITDTWTLWGPSLPPKTRKRVEHELRRRKLVLPQEP